MPVWKLDDGMRIGKVLKPNGYLGYIKVAFLFSGLDEVIDADDFIFIEWTEKPVPYHVEEILWDDDKTARIKLKDIDNDEQAKKLNGRAVLISEKKLPDDLMDEETTIEFSGFKVIDTGKNEIGIVTGIDERGPQSLLEVDRDGKELLIPVHEDLIKKIDVKKKVIIVDLPDGLLEL